MRKTVLAVLLLFLVSALYSATASKIGGWIEKHNETGYKFVKQIDKSTWQVQFKMKDWKYSWNVYTQIRENESYPDFNVVCIFTTVASYKSKPNSTLMTYLLKLNTSEASANWGNFTLKEYDDGDWEVYYMIKLRQNTLDSETLINAIGFVAGYANSMYEDIEEMGK